MTVPNDHLAPEADPALADVETAGLDLAAAYDSGDPPRIDRAAAAYIAACELYDAAAARQQHAEATAADVIDADQLAAMGTESVMPDGYVAPCCGYPDPEAGA
jgi:hypothetical protein